ncbi:KinB signaling pathway activation protein [Paenibacillus protaetiae]|uniref:KinB signaling pathway activation protein n=2 Tax=Paenibacillus protaetiae TaxID=2509456 RepID=A0A4P6F090_9BACL|nr:KinB signaling pathway activation protein [Paenibacillus protaetiae]
MLVGLAASVITGSIMQWTDHDFGFMGLKAAGFNAFMMAIVGLMFGAFSHMGFFAYLTLNYIALSIFRKSYLWNALQGYSTLFAAGWMGYMLYKERSEGVLFWLLPLGLLACAAIVSYVKIKQTNSSAFIPSMFLLFTITFIEAWPALQGELNVAAIIFMMIPLFACNAYQIMMLHRILGNQTADSPAAAVKSAQ